MTVLIWLTSQESSTSSNSRLWMIGRRVNRLSLNSGLCFSGSNMQVLLLFWKPLLTCSNDAYNTLHFSSQEACPSPSILPILVERVEMPELRARAKQQRQIKRRDGQRSLSKIHPEHHISENGIICTSCTEHRLQHRLKTFVDKTMESSRRYCLVKVGIPK